MDRFEWDLCIIKWIITSVEHKLVVPNPIQMLTKPSYHIIIIIFAIGVSLRY